MAANNLTNFVKKIQKRLGEKKVKPTKKLLIGDFDEELMIEALNTDEKKECVSFSDDPMVQDRYFIYRGCPTIRSLAARLMEIEAIDEPLDVLNAFKDADLAELARQIARFSGVFEKTTIKEAGEIKNS